METDFVFKLIDGTLVTVPGELLETLPTLKSNIVLAHMESEEVKIHSLSFEMSTPALFQWIIDASIIIRALGENDINLRNFAHLYEVLPLFNSLIRLQRSRTEPLCSLFGLNNQPGVNDLPTLIELVDLANFLEATELSVVVLEKVYRLLANVPSAQLVTKSDKKRKQEARLNHLPYSPYYIREKLIYDFLAQALPSDLIRANRALEKYVKPFTLDFYFFYGLSEDNLYEYESRYGYRRKTLGDLPGKPLLISATQSDAVCLTTEGLYSKSHSVQSVWKKVDIDGEVLLIESGDSHTFVLTTTGLYAVGYNSKGQLALGDEDGRVELTPVPVNWQGFIRSVHCFEKHTIIVTTEGIYACGSNDSDRIGIGALIDHYTVPVPLRIEGKVISVGLGTAHTLILTTAGLFGMGARWNGQFGIFPTIEDLNLHIIPLNERVYYTGTPLAVYCGYAYSIVKTTDGLFATGHNDRGQLARGSTDDMVYQFSKMLGLEGEIHSVTCMHSTVIVVTTTGLYQSGVNMDFSETSRSGDEDSIPWFTEFTRITKFDLGYFDENYVEEIDDTERKQSRLLQCVHCGGEGVFVHMKECLPVCKARPTCPPEGDTYRCESAKDCIYTYGNCTHKRMCIKKDQFDQHSTGRCVTYYNCEKDQDCRPPWRKDFDVCDPIERTCKSILVGAPGPDSPSEENENSSSNSVSWFIIVFTVLMMIILICSCLYALDRTNRRNR